jgi:D-alanine-D-alanine ligase
MASANGLLALPRGPANGLGSGSVGTPRPTWRHRLIRPKGNLGMAGQIALLLLVGVPLLMVLSRIAAYPEIAGRGGFGLDFLRPLGVILNNHWSLTWLPAIQRPTVVYLLMLPTGALIIALARLTFGLRVFGLRAILIAIGFQEIGAMPGLMLMAAVIVVTVAIRPAMQRLRLPLFARVTVILSLCSGLMVLALLAGPLMKSETVWSVAFFPVIITAMIAEAVAKSIANDSAFMAAWRVGWTIVIAGIIAVIGQTGPAANLMLTFPELMLLQMAAIIVIAEYFDWRLMEGVPERIQRVIEKKDWSMWWAPPIPRIAVVRNPPKTSRTCGTGDPDNEMPAESPNRSLQQLVRALRNKGAIVRVFDGDAHLLRELSKFLPPDSRTGAPGGLVLNLATGVQGIGMPTHIPAMLELAGIPYSGPDPVVHGHLLDRSTLLSRLQRAGLNVPNSWRLRDIHPDELHFPLWIYPPHHVAVPPARFKNRKDLEAYAMEFPATLRKHLLLEEVVDGREIRVALIGNDRIDCLPLLEKVAGQRQRICPAELDETLASQVRESAITAFNAAGCRDYARIDLRVTPAGEVVVTSLNVHEILACGGSFAQSAKAAGLGYEALITRIVRVVCDRYCPTPHSALRTPHRLIPTLRSTLLFLIFTLAFSSSAPATRLIEPADLVKPGFGMIRFQTAGGEKLTAHIYRASRFDSTNGRIWFVMHGVNRNAEDYAKAAAPVAERVNALLVVVEFSRTLYPDGSDYTLGVTTRGSPDGRALKEGRWRTPDAYVYSEIERLFGVIRTTLGGEQSGYYLFGHSAGAQFVHRMLTFLPNAKVLGAVAANAGWYTLPVRGGPHANESPECTMPYGLEATPVDDNAVKALLGRRLTILLGELDTASEDANLRDTPEAQSQGKNRFQRGKHYFQLAQREAHRLGTPFNWRLATVHKARHRAGDILPSTIPFLFTDDMPLCEPAKATNACGPAPLVFADFKYDPPAGDAGDFNRDGRRVGTEDEYVTLRNTGEVPLCISGWTVGDVENRWRHVFPLGTCLNPGESLILFGGGIPTGDFAAQVQWARSGTLSLSNDGDTIELRDSAGRLAQTISW